MAAYFEKSNQLRGPSHHLISGGTHTYTKGEVQYPVLSPSHVWDADGNEYERRRGNRAVERGQADQPVFEVAVSARARLGDYLVERSSEVVFRRFNIRPAPVRELELAANG